MPETPRSFKVILRFMLRSVATIRIQLYINTSLKKIEKKAFSKYLSSSNMEALKVDPFSPCNNNKSRRTTFCLEVSSCQCHERGIATFQICKRQKRDIEWMESSRDNGIHSANTQEE